MSPDGSQVKFSAADEAELAAYSKPSVQAIVALLLGLLSPIALIHPLYWIVPLVTVVLSLIALRKIASSDGQLTGRTVALLALGLALLFGAWASSRHYSRQSAVFGQARQYSQAWLDLVLAGRLYEAYELHLSSSSRHPPGTSLEEIYGEISLPLEAPVNERPGGFNPTSQPKESFLHFFTTPPLSRIVTVGARGQARFAGNDQLQYDNLTHSDLIFQKYTITYDENGQQQSFGVVVALRRVVARGSTDALWYVENVSEPSQ
jgi:hypothetical protein